MLYLSRNQLKYIGKFMATIDTVKITKIGNSLGIILSKEILAKLNAEKGDEFIVTETSSGIQISAHNEKVERQLEIAKEVMKKHYSVLKKLAE
jgi:putative addiction module antidote